MVLISKSLLRLIALFLSIANSKCLELHTASIIENFNVLMLPYGVNFTTIVPANVRDVMASEHWNITNASTSCTEHYEELSYCNGTLSDFIAKVTKSEDIALNVLVTECEHGRPKCLQKEILKSGILKTWFIRYRDVLHSLCWHQCWRILLTMDQNCLNNKSVISPEILFLHEVLDAFCSEPHAPTGEEISYCTDKLLDGLLVPPSQPNKVCELGVSIRKKSCTSHCYEEVSSFFDMMDKCAGSVYGVMNKYKITPASGTFGQLIENSYEWCGQTIPGYTRKDPSSTESLNTINSTKHTSSKPSSLPTQIIVAVVLAVLVGCSATFLLGRCLYQRVVYRTQSRVEDYGYSRLKMMEDQQGYFYNDEDDGLLTL